MTDEDDIDGLAAEFVLGSLTPLEREQVNSRRRTDGALRNAIEAWEKRLGTLADGVPGVEPPGHVYPAIVDRLWGQGGGSTKGAPAVPFPRSARRWRRLAVAAAALAACLALLVAWLFHSWPSSPTTFVAQLHRNAAGSTADETAKSAGPPGFVVSLDLAARTIKVTPVAARPASRRSYQLWLTEGGSATPIQLGIVPQSEPTTLPWGRQDRPQDLVNATLSISLEPEGGTQTGLPSGPIVFIGKLVPATP